MSDWMKVYEDVRRGGLVYICTEGHDFHFGKEDVLKSIKGEGPNRPDKCPTCEGLAQAAALDMPQEAMN